jgi:hypothetical protein
MEKWKFFTLPGFELPPPLVVQPVASRYTDWAIPAPLIIVCIVDKICLPRRCLAIDILLFRAFGVAGMYLATRCLAIGMSRTT